MAKKDDFDWNNMSADTTDFSESVGDSWGSEGKEKKKKEKKPITFTRVMGCLVVIGIVSFGIVSIVKSKYYEIVIYPEQKEVVYSETGINCLESWKDSMVSLKGVGEGSYIAEEVVYANGDNEKISFYSKMLSLVDYLPEEEIAENIYGNPMIDRDTNEMVYIQSYVDSGDEVTFIYPDYTKIDFEAYSDKIAEIMTNRDLKFGDVNYETKLVSAFVGFMNWLPAEEIPLVETVRVPSMTSTPGGYTITLDEDIYIDRLLFSSNEFYQAMDNFSYVADTVTGGQPGISEEFVTWVNSGEVGVRPSSWGYKECCTKLWCGSYYLKNDYVEYDEYGNITERGLVANLGNGTLANPAGVGTSVVTDYYISEYDELGNIINYTSYPIKVTLKGYGLSEDAINYFESKDTRNRGISLSSEVQYIYFLVEVQNLSGTTLKIEDNLGLCDENANMTSRTGTIYGLNDTLTLKPDEKGIIETWWSAGELWKKHVVWGKDFSRRSEPVWFRILAGDIDTDDPFKGVTVNNSRGEYDDSLFAPDYKDNTSNSPVGGVDSVVEDEVEGVVEDEVTIE